MAADELDQQILSANWMGTHQEEHQGKKPVVIVGFVQTSPTTDAETS